ncbi:MAG: Rha family transcriptional regulator [Plesiomonas shigelloides]
MNDIQLFRQLISINDGQPVTTSRKIAELFGKRHADVLRRISGLECSPDFNQRNFAFVEYVDDKGEARPEFNITKDGTAFLIMGFTGKKAAEFKEAYINAFNWMHGMLQQRHDIDMMLSDFTKRESLSVSNGSIHGRGLAQRRKEKRDLICEMKEITEKLQCVLPLLENK